jgi:hypothetical protein
MCSEFLQWNLETLGVHVYMVGQAEEGINTSFFTVLPRPSEAEIEICRSGPILVFGCLQKLFHFRERFDIRFNRLVFDEAGLARVIDLGAMMFLLEADGEFLGVGDDKLLSAQQDTSYHSVPMLAFDDVHSHTAQVDLAYWQMAPLEALASAKRKYNRPCDKDARKQLLRSCELDAALLNRRCHQQIVELVSTQYYVNRMKTHSKKSTLFENTILNKLERRVLFLHIDDPPDNETIGRTDHDFLQK